MPPESRELWAEPGRGQPASLAVLLLTGTRKSASATSGLGQGLADMMYGLLLLLWLLCCLPLPVPVLKSNNNNLLPSPPPAGTATSPPSLTNKLLFCPKIPRETCFVCVWGTGIEIETEIETGLFHWGRNIMCLTHTLRYPLRGVYGCLRAVCNAWKKIYTLPSLSI